MNNVLPTPSPVRGRLQKEREFHDDTFSGGGARRQASEYYAVALHAFRYFHSLVAGTLRADLVLDYGCGDWGAGFVAAEQGSRLVAIDISRTALQRYLRGLSARGVAAAGGLQMNAEELAFGSETFDLICGMGILHHLDLERSFSEIARTLTPEGKAFFMEPMGHNPIINLYRRRTPKARTEDEHPLLCADIELARRYFGRVETRFFNLCTLVAIPLRRWPFFNPVLRALHAADMALFRILPSLRRQAWMVVLSLSEPRRGQPP